MAKTEQQEFTAPVPKPDRPVVMIGMMGVGKTKVGRDLAAALNLPFYDSDDEIEQAAGMSIPDIFEKYGEAHFREGEHRVIKRLLEGDACVISTGGGAVMTPDTADLIWNNAISIWIDTDIDDILQRISHNIEKRPLLTQGDPKTILQELLVKRKPVYQKANIHYKNDYDAPTEKDMDRLIDMIRIYLDDTRSA